MRKILSTLLIFVLTSGLLIGQQVDEKKTHESKISVGLKFGPTFSKYIPGSIDHEVWLAGSTSYDVTYEKKYRLGFNAGLFTEVQFSKHFSTRFEYNYYYSSKHDVKYIEYESGAVATDYYGIYTFNSSTTQLTILPKIFFGQQDKIYILIGPYFDLLSKAHNFTGSLERVVHYYPGHPASDTVFVYDKTNRMLNSPIGAVLGTGINIPLNKNFVCLELRLGYSIGDSFSSPNMRLILASMNIIYFIKLK